MDARKLTKKQKKGLAFRQGKRKVKEQEDIPASDLVEDVEEPVASQVPEVGKKRKRVDGEPRSMSTKRRKDDTGDVAASGEGTEVEEGGQAKKTKDTARRFILFVGNLPKDVTVEKISEHFVSCPTSPTIRLRTPPPTKANSAKPPAGRPRVFAFLEFQDAPSLQAALKLHRSNLGGKLINVELTVGGGGKGSNRTEKIKAKRVAVQEQIKQAQDAGRSGDGGEGRTERQDFVREKQPVRAKDGQRRPARSMGTGVNAIPVG